jgi:hypothetical protein
MTPIEQAATPCGCDGIGLGRHTHRDTQPTNKGLDLGDAGSQVAGNGGSGGSDGQQAEHVPLAGCYVQHGRTSVVAR